MLDRYKYDLSEDNVAQASIAVARAKVLPPKRRWKPPAACLSLAALARPAPPSILIATGATGASTPCTTRCAGNISCWATGCSTAFVRNAMTGTEMNRALAFFSRISTGRRGAGQRRYLDHAGLVAGLYLC